MCQQMPTANTQEHKRNEGAPSATKYIIARDAVKAKPRHGRGHCVLMPLRVPRAHI